MEPWFRLRNVEANGERNRLLFVLKSRGTAHSNQVREFVLTGHGVELVDVYVGAAGVLAGSARLAQQATERDTAARQASDLDRRLRGLRRSVVERRGAPGNVQDQLDAERAEINRIDLREDRRCRYRGGSVSDGDAPLGRCRAAQWRPAMSNRTGAEGTGADSTDTGGNGICACT